jgi:hypothetical protein
VPKSKNRVLSLRAFVAYKKGETYQEICQEIPHLIQTKGRVSDILLEDLGTFSLPRDIKQPKRALFEIDSKWL